MMNLYRVSVFSNGDRKRFAVEASSISVAIGRAVRGEKLGNEVKVYAVLEKRNAGMWDRDWETNSSFTP